MKKNQQIASYLDKIYDLSRLRDWLRPADPNTLVIFDVDDTLTIPSNDNDFRHPYRIKLLKLITNRLTKKKVELLKSIIISASNQIIVDHEIINLFKTLKSQCIASIALTSIPTGKFGVIPSMEDLKIEELNNLDISFTALTPMDGEHLAPDLGKNNKFFPNNTIIPMLKSGIVFTANCDKGKVLKHMFSHHNYYPKTIMLIDNNLKNFKSLQQLCLELNINFYSFNYAAASLVPIPNINSTLEKLRFEILERQWVWLSCKQLSNVLFHI